MNTKNIDNWQARICEIKHQLSILKDMRPGSISEQYNVCGNPTCRCKDPKSPQRHGPYFQLRYTHKGKGTTEFVKKEMVEEVRKQIQNYRTFKELTDEWIELSIMIAKQRKKDLGK